jgi:AcrR family transcriptional regulator
MAMNQNDPRVIKTRRGLGEALTRLIIKKGYDAVTIQDIADEAQTARITFYRHYKDKEELLTDCLNGLYEELAERTEKMIGDGMPLSTSPVLVFFEHLQEKEALYRILFSSRGTQVVVDRMKDVMTRRLMENMALLSLRQSLPVPVEIVAYHLVSAQVGLGIWWLENDKPYPAEYMAQAGMWLSFTGVGKALGVEGLEAPSPAAE